MASPSTVGLLELFQLFLDQESARLYLKEKRWGGKRLKEIGVQQKTAWFMLGRLKEACGNDSMKSSSSSMRAT